MKPFEYLKVASSLLIVFWTQCGVAQFFPSVFSPRSSAPGGPSLFPVLNTNNINNNNARPAQNSLGGNSGWPYLGGNDYTNSKPQQLVQQIQQPLQNQNWQQSPSTPDLLQGWQQSPSTPSLLQGWQQSPSTPSLLQGWQQSPSTPSLLQGWQQSPSTPDLLQGWQQSPSSLEDWSRNPVSQPYFNNGNQGPLNSFNSPQQTPSGGFNNGPFNGLNNFFNNPNYLQQPQQQLSQQPQQQLSQSPQQLSLPPQQLSQPQLQQQPAEYLSTNPSNSPPAYQPFPNSRPTNQIQTPPFPFSGDKTPFPNVQAPNTSLPEPQESLDDKTYFQYGSGSPPPTIDDKNSFQSGNGNPSTSLDDRNTFESATSPESLSSNANKKPSLINQLMSPSNSDDKPAFGKPPSASQQLNSQSSPSLSKPSLPLSQRPIGSSNLAQPQKPFQQSQWTPPSNDDLNIPSPSAPPTPTNSQYDDGLYKPEIYGEGNYIGGNNDGQTYLYNNTGTTQMNHQQEHIHNFMQGMLGGKNKELDVRVDQLDNDISQEKGAQVSDKGPNQFLTKPTDSSPVSSPVSSIQDPSTWAYPDD